MEQFEQKFSVYFDYIENIRKRVFSVAIAFFASSLSVFSNQGTFSDTSSASFGCRMPRSSPHLLFNSSTWRQRSHVYRAFGVRAYRDLSFVRFFKGRLEQEGTEAFYILLPIGLALFAAGFAYCFAILYFYLNSVSAINLSFGIKNIWDVSSLCRK